MWSACDAHVYGEGPAEILFVPGWVSHVDLFWQYPEPRAFFTELAGFARVAVYDKPGTGASDPVAEAPSLELRVEQLIAVMAAAGLERATVIGVSEGGVTACLAAAARPDRVGQLVMLNASAAAFDRRAKGLQVLEQKMGELKITSLRFSEKTSIAVPHSTGKLMRVLKLLLGAGSGISGEGTTSPPAGNVVLSLFGHPLRLRAVDNTTYFYLRALGRVDHGRPWVKLGPGGLAELFTVNGKHIKAPKTSEPKIGEPALAEPPFEGLRKLLTGAKEVRELGAGTVDGQPVTSFLAVLEPEQLGREHLASAARLRLPPPAPPAPTVSLEVSLTQNGLPVRTVITEHGQGTVISVTLEIPAINFPLVIEPPPISQTITLAQLRKLERQARKHSHRHARR